MKANHVQISDDDWFSCLIGIIKHFIFRFIVFKFVNYHSKQNHILCEPEGVVTSSKGLFRDIGSKAVVSLGAGSPPDNDKTQT